ncbi:hypothetical protein GOODEAATRI_026534 [Goodea atripinnis]|uniref:SH3 domain-containing protein n=1 Tax=Goodea atripinnis TaxID=208336 RepID=A0ABV0MWT0_9TELE
MIMPSEDELRSSVGHDTGVSVTQPFITETYRCVAPFETKDTKNKPFKAAVDEKFDVLIKDITGTLYQVVKSYSSTKDDEVSVDIGTVVEVLRKSENGWWLIRPTSPNLTGTHRSQSLNRLSDGPNAQPAASHSVPAQKHSTTPTSAMQGPAPVIMVQSDREKTGRILRGESVDSFESDSDNALSMSASSSLNLSYSANDEQLQLCRTSPPMVASCLSPTNNPKGTLLPSVSDPNLYKGPRSPKVPPRPQPREILTRCTTVTCKNATKSNLSHKLR